MRFGDLNVRPTGFLTSEGVFGGCASDETDKTIAERKTQDLIPRNTPKDNNLTIRAKLD
jgi:hypothetical protein